MSSGRDGSVHDFAWSASVLTDRFGEIFDDYRRRLEEGGSLLTIVGGLEKGRLETQARALVDHTATLLRGGRVPSGAEAGLYPDSKEASEEVITAHPDESLRAGSVLCEAMLKVLVEELPEGCPPRDAVTLSLTVQKSVMDQVGQISMSAYTNHLLNKVHETQIEERKRFSRELHDQVAHSIAVINQSLELYEYLRERNPEEAEQRLSRARKVGKETVRVARDMAGEMRDVGTSEGLHVALENLLGASVARGMEYAVSVKGNDESLSAQVRDQLYLILREGIRNAVAHSESERVEVTIDISPEEAKAGVTDYGKGFDLDGKLPEHGIGLKSMRERTSLLGGTLEVSSGPGKGTSAVVRLPLTKDRGEDE